MTTRAGGFPHIITMQIIATMLMAVSVLGTPSAFAAEASLAARPLTLAQAESLFLTKNREVLAARRSTEAAQADVLSAGAPQNPVLSLGTTNISPGAGIGAGRPHEKRLDTTVALTQLFERGNKRELRRSVAEQMAAAARGDQADVLRQQRTALHAAFYELLLAQEKVRISSDSATLFDKTMDAAEKRLNAGDIAAAEVARLRVDALRAMNESRNAQAELQRAQQTLAYMVGLEKEASGLSAEAIWEAPAVPPAPATLDAILEARADVQAAHARLAAAERNRELARALRTRDVTAGIQFERYPGDVANNSYGVMFSMPLFTHYYYDGEIRRSEVEYTAAGEDLERVRAQVLTEVSRRRSDLLGAAERAARLRDVLLAAARKAADGAEFAYARGALGVMDLLDARRQLYAARLEAAIVNAEYAKALSAWRSATETSSSQ